MSAGLEFTVLTDQGEWSVKTDMRDVIGWERYSRRHNLPARSVETDPNFPQGEYMAHLAWTASKRDQRTQLDWDGWLGVFQGIQIDQAAIQAAAAAQGLPDPTQPAAGPG